MQPWRAGKVYFWERAPFFRILLPLVVGIAWYLQQPHPVLSLSSGLMLLVVCLFLYGATAFIRKRNTVLDIAGFVSFHAWIVMAGWLLCYCNDVRNNQQWFGHGAGNENAYVVRVSDVPTEKAKTWKLPVQVLYALNEEEPKSVMGKAFVYVYKSDVSLSLHKGDTIIVPNRWRRISNYKSGAFDYAAYCARNNIYYQQFIAAKNIGMYAHATATDVGPIEGMHNWCMTQLDTYIQDKETKGLLQAMLLGDEVNLDDELRQSYAATGIVHIIAISGGNVIIFFNIISWLLIWLRNKKYEWIKYVVALPLVWIYVLMAGAPPSAVRAALMFSIVAIGYALQKEKNGINSLFAAAVLLLCVMPAWLFSVGFQLSFVAVLSLMLFYSPLYKLWAPVNKISKGLWSAVVASVAAEILVAPLVIYYFHMFPVMFVVANVLAYLFMGIVLVLAMLVVAFGFVPVLAKLFAVVAVTIVTGFDKVIGVLQHWNPAACNDLHLSGLELALVYAIIAATAIWLMKKSKRAVLVALATSCLLAAALCMDEWQAIHAPVALVYGM